MRATPSEPELVADDILDLRREFLTIDDGRWKHCHASSVVSIGSSLLGAWFAGSSEGADDTGIWLSRRDADTGWSKAERVDEGENVPHWNPVLAIAPDDTLWLFFKRGHDISKWQTLVRISADGGRSFSPVRALVPGDRGGRGPVKNPPLVVGERWFAPASVERWDGANGVTAQWDAFIDVSDDSGAHWRPVGLPLDHTLCHGAGAIQPALWRNADGGVTALCRSSEGRGLRSTSNETATDRTLTFSELEKSALPNNNSGLGAAAFDVDGRRVVACAHNSADDDWGSRSTLVLSLSLDDGLTWYRAGRIDGLPDGVTPGADALSVSHPSARTVGRPRTASARGVVTDGMHEYSYPTVIVNRQMLFVSYTWQRRGIALATIPINALSDVVRLVR